MADQALIQSGANLAQAELGFVDYGKSFQEGSQLMQNQIDKNLKEQQDAELREFQMKRLQQEEELRTLGLEEAYLQKEERNAVGAAMINQGVELGIIDPTDYPMYQQMGNDWLKDQSNQLKILADAGGREALKGRIDNVVNGQANINNVFSLAQGATPGADFPEAQALDFAIEELAKSGKKPGVVTENGVDYFVIPRPGGGEDFKIKSDVFATAKNFSDLAGQYEEAKSFSSSIADWQTGNTQVLNRLSKGQGTSADIASIGQWFLSNAKTPAQQQELLDTFITSSGITPGSEAANQIGLQDTNNDGKLTSADISSGDFAQVFTGAVMASFDIPEQQQGDIIASDAIDQKLKKGKYAPKAPQPTQTDADITNAINTGNYKSLVGKPVKTGVKGEYISRVVAPGDKIKSGGREKESDQWVIVTSKGTTIPAGSDPSKVLTEMTGGQYQGKPEIPKRKEGESIADYQARIQA